MPRYLTENPNTRTINGCLDWLARMDPNGIWREYQDDFAEASAEHGPLTLAELREVIAEMLE